MFLSMKLNYKSIHRRGFVCKGESLLGTGHLKAAANTWAAVEQPQIPSICGIWRRGAPLYLLSLCFVCLPHTPRSRRKRQRLGLK